MHFTVQDILNSIRLSYPQPEPYAAGGEGGGGNSEKTWEKI